MVHLMIYLRCTRTMPLFISANGSGTLKWWVDALLALGLSLGRGFTIVSSTKQKLNTWSSTETEIVGADDVMPVIYWNRYFMKAQGYNLQDNILFQDNKSSILLEKNRKASSSKCTKHINIRHFFITNRVSTEEVSVVWCPTGDLIRDYWYATKPLQGSLFRKFRDHIMGVVPAPDPGPGKTDGGIGKSEINKKTSLLQLRKGASPQECVGSGTRTESNVNSGAGRTGRQAERIRNISNFNQSKGKSGKRSSRPDGHSPSSPHSFKII
jgi:hypothetical protein